MGKRTEIICGCGCGESRMAQNSDIKRGWGRYINASHAAKGMHIEGRGKSGAHQTIELKENNKDLFNKAMSFLK
tara:strand:- start:5088 stop:5309 length:222 start_codon:yes stop_codon:yes gene_type:complete